MARDIPDIVVVETWAGQGSPRRVFTEAAGTYSSAVIVAKSRMDVIPDAQYARLYAWGYDFRNNPELLYKKVVMAHG